MQISQSFISRLLSHSQLIIIFYRIKTLGFLFLFFFASPLTLLISFITFIIHFITRKSSTINPQTKRILISGGAMTKSLQLARSFHSAGYYVVLTEEYPYTPYRFSRCVSRFCLHADSDDHPRYIQSIIDIVKEEKIDVFVPVSHSSNECTDALIKQALLPLNCETIHGDVKQLNMLNDKHMFVNQARSYGLTVPKSFKITSPKQLLEFDFSKEQHQFILKSTIYNSMARSNPKKLPCQSRQEMIDYVNSLTINERSPWIMQEFISGKEYCTHGTVRNGELRLYTCCESSSWLLNYRHLDNQPKILEWTQDFCSRANLTGQASFDFIESDEDGLPYAIECNPRTHTAITTFYNHPRVAEAYLDKEPLFDGPIQPYPNARETYWLYHELWNLLQVRQVDNLRRHLKRLFHGKEAIYSVQDPLPFLLHYTMHMPYLLINNLRYPSYYSRVDCNLALLL